jgi:hypothetical protein
VPANIDHRHQCRPFYTKQTYVDPKRHDTQKLRMTKGTISCEYVTTSDTNERRFKLCDATVACASCFSYNTWQAMENKPRFGDVIRALIFIDVV